MKAGGGGSRDNFVFLGHGPLDPLLESQVFLQHRRLQLSDNGRITQINLISKVVKTLPSQTMCCEIAFATYRKPGSFHVTGGAAVAKPNGVKRPSHPGPQFAHAHVLP